MNIPLKWKTYTRYCVRVSGKLSPRKIAPRSGLGFGLGLVLELGSGAIFLGGNFPRTLCKDLRKHLHKYLHSICCCKFY